MLLWTLFLVAPFTVAHSWIECTDYRGPITGLAKDYDVDQCYGFGRDWTQINMARIGGFGLDRGYNYQPYGNNKRTCRDALDGNRDYTSEYPMAEYTAGQQVNILWPAKNHARIRNFGMRLYGCCDCSDSVVNDIDRITQDKYLVQDWGRQERNNMARGFGECKDLSDTDKAVCDGTFTVPDDMSGECTFVWFWAFNSDTDAYTTCWEAVVDGDGATPSPTRRPTAAPTATARPTSTPTKTPTRSPTSTTSPSPPSQEWNCQMVCELV